MATISTRVPGEFRYSDHVGDKRVQRARKAWRALFRFDPQPSDDYVRAFANAYYDADPVAEAFVDEVYFQRGSAEGRRMLDQAIEHGVDAVPDAPESMRALFAEFERDPEWVDREQVALGAKVFRRWGTAVFSFATTSTLEMYSENSITKPLSLAGATPVTRRIIGNWRRSGSGSTSRRQADSSRVTRPCDGDVGPDHARVHPAQADGSPGVGCRRLGRADQHRRRCTSGATSATCSACSPTGTRATSARRSS